MMKEFQFTKIYFNKTSFEDFDSKIRVFINETPSLNISEEEYSLRVKIRYEDPNFVSKYYAIEHHLPPSKHSFPHLQFKFHTDEIGQFRIRIKINDEEDYKNVILGFIYKIRILLGDLEKLRKGITEDILVLPLVDKLEEKSFLLTKKIIESFNEYKIEFDEPKDKEKLEKLQCNKLFLKFIGMDNIKFLEQ